MIKNIKRKVYLKLEKRLSDGLGKNTLILMNNIFFHWSQRRHIVHPGKQNSDKVYYVVRPSGPVEGLLSLYHSATMAAWNAQEEGFIPYIDYENTPTQYQENMPVHGTKNVWEYYFMQPSDVSAREVQASRNVVLSGWSIRNQAKEKEKNRIWWDPRFRNFCQERCAIQPYILDIIKKRKKELHIDDKVLAVFLRGTDYVLLKPKGHAVQPTPEQVMQKVEEFLKEYNLNRIFLVTEDQKIREKFEQHFGNMVFYSDTDFIKEYDGKDYVANSMQVPPYQRGLNYLIRILLMMECQYLVSSIASGSIFALNMKKEAYIESYVFDLGVYI